MIVRRQIYVSGKVQGVFYRQSTKTHADKLDVKGHVSNLPDGRVYIEAEAEETVLRSFIEWCHKGPLMAEVTDVEVITIDVAHSEDFSIRK